MYYELRMYTPYKGKLDGYAELFHKLPEQVYAEYEAKVVGMWETDDTDQPAFAYLVQFRDRAHRDKFMKDHYDSPLMSEYSPQRPQFIDRNVPSKNFLLKPVKHSKMQ